MRGLVSWVSKTYNNISIIITENGMSDDGSSLEDDARIDQIRVRIRINDLIQILSVFKIYTN